MSNAVLSVPDQQVTKTAGRYQITAQTTVDGGYAINTFTATGGTRIPELCFSTPDRDTYRLVYAVIRDGGVQGVSPEGVREALTDALTRELHEVQRRRDTPSVNRVEHINRLLDRLESPADAAAVAELAATVRRTLADTVPAGTKPQVAPSRSGVERQPLTGPQVRIISGHINGVVYAGKGVSWVSLRSIARKGYTSEVHYVPGTQRIASIVLNKHGRAASVAVAR